jgi:glycosyltransferase involved in cell wall biosynthesis
MINCLLIGPTSELAGGEGTYIRSLMEFPPQGIDYSLYSLREPYSDQIIYENQYIKNYFYPYKAFRGLRKYKLLFPDVETFFIRMKEKFDLIHLHIYSAKFLNKEEIPIILSDSSASYIFLRDYLKWKEEKIKLYYLIGKAIYKTLGIYHQLLNLRDATKLIVWSEFAKKIHMDFGNEEEKIEVVPPGLSLGKTKEKIDDIIRLLFIGDFQRKGGDLVLRAFERVEKDYDNIQLEMITNLPGDIKIKSEKIISRAPVRREELLKEIYPRADVFVFPTRAEGFGISCIEAMSFGIPIITTNISAMPEIVEDKKTGFLIPVDDINALTHSLRILIEDEKVRKKQRENTEKKFREKFWNETTNKKLAKIYQEIVEK